jgi:hypothetical protein
MKSAKASAQAGFAMKRRMTAIMVGDIVGYSVMLEKSEEKTIARLATCPDCGESCLARWQDIQ